MLILDILHIPIEFIREHLTGWILLIVVVFIIYFICLRKYYIQREKFYDVGEQLKNLEDVESVEDDINSSSINSSRNDKENKKDMHNARKEYKQERTALKNSNGVDYQFNQNDSNDTSRHTTIKANKANTANTSNKAHKAHKANNANKEKVLEGFNSDISITPSISATSSNISASIPPIATTLFDNLNLNDTQVQACKANYNQVIAQLISDLGKLNCSMIILY